MDFTDIQITNVVKGKDGASINRIVEWYGLSASGDTEPTQWSDTMLETTPSLPYLWNYEVVYDDNGDVVSSTEPHVLSVYGKSIESIVDYYIVVGDGVVPGTDAQGWVHEQSDIDALELTDTTPCMWNYELITYTDGSTNIISPHMVGRRGDDGITPYINGNGYWVVRGVPTSIKAQGEAGTSVSVRGTSTLYGIGASGTNYNDVVFDSTTPKTPTDAMPYKWSKTTVTFTDNSTAISYSVTRDGENGDTIQTVTNRNYYASATILTQAQLAALENTAWKETSEDCQFSATKKYLYVREQTTVVTNGTSGTPTNRYMLNSVWGEKGENITITTSWTKYIRNTSSTLPSTTSSDWAVWNESTHGFSEGKYLHSWTRVEYSDGTNTNDFDTRYYNKKFSQTRTTKYSTIHTATQPADATFTLDAIGTVSNGDYVWSRTTTTYSGDNAPQPTYEYSVSRIGADGNNGNGIHVAYATSADGVSNFSTSWFSSATYVGICVLEETGSTADPTTPSSYDWSLIKGDDAYILDLDNENDTMLYDRNGTLLSGNVVSSASLYHGASKVNSGVTYSIESSSGCTATINASGVVTVTAMSAASGHVLVKAVYGSVIRTAELTLKKVQGIDKFDIIVSHSSVSINADGSIVSPTTLYVKINKTNNNGLSDYTAQVSTNPNSGVRLLVSTDDNAYNIVTRRENGRFVIDCNSYTDDAYIFLRLVDENDAVRDTETIPIVADGADGLTPFINGSGYWQIGDIATSIKAEGVGIASQQVRYATGASGTTAPTSGWVDSVPSVADGSYLWTWARVEYTDGSHTDAYTAARQGENGTNGTNGDTIYTTTDRDFKAFSSTKTQEQLIAVPDADWEESSEDAGFSETNKYLYERASTYRYTNGNLDSGYPTHKYMLNSVWGNDGETPEIGANGNWWIGSVDLQKPSRGANGTSVTISSQTIRYTNNTDETNAPIYNPNASGSAQKYTNTTPPTPQQGKYIYGVTYVVFSDGTTSTAYSSTYSGINGDTIATTIERDYYASSSVMTDSQLANVTTWSDSTPSNYSETNKYLYCRERNYTTTNSSTPVLNGTRYILNGVWGARGSRGASIASVTEQYGVSASPSTQPTDWGTLEAKKALVGKSNPYLWNRETSLDTDGNTISTVAAHVIFIWTKDGAAGASINTITNYYRTTTTATVPSKGTTSPWSTSPIVTDATNRYLWNYEVITYTEGKASTSTDVALLGVYGESGKDSCRFDLTNENDSMLYDDNGNKLSSNVTTTAKFFEGTTERTPTVTIEGYTGCSQPSVSGTTITVSGMTANEASVVVKGVYNGVTRFATLSLKKLVNVTKYDIIASDSSVGIAQDGTLSTSTITVKVYKTDVNGRVDYTSSVKTSQSQTGVHLWISTDDATWSVLSTLSGGVFNINCNNYADYDFIYLQVTDESGKVRDHESIPIVADGRDGASPEIRNGVWYIGGVPTGINATGEKGDSITVTSQSTKYGIGSSRTSHNDVSFSSNDPIAPTTQKPYMWSRSTIVFSDGSSSVSYTVTEDGDNGTNGDTITVVTDKDYATSATAIANISSISTWYESVASCSPSYSQSVPYLYARETSTRYVNGVATAGTIGGKTYPSVNYYQESYWGQNGTSVLAQYSVNGTSNWHATYVAGDIYMRTSSDSGNTWSTAVRIVGEKGGKGDGGPYTDYSFARSSSLTSSNVNEAPDGIDRNIGTNGWNDAPIATTSAYPYLWQKQQKMVWNATTNAYVESGNATYIRINGEKGSNGRSVTGTDVVFAQHYSSTNTPADSNWVSLISELSLIKGYYIWTCTKTTFSSGSPTYTGKYCLGLSQDFANAVEQYLLTTSASAPSSWTGASESVPSPVKGRYLWTCVKVTIKENGQSDATTQYLNVRCIQYYPTDGEDGTVFSVKERLRMVFSNESGRENENRSWSSAEEFVWRVDPNDEVYFDDSTPLKGYGLCDEDGYDGESYADTTVIYYYERTAASLTLFEKVTKANEGDGYIDTVTGQLFVVTDSVWKNLGSIKGADGDDAKEYAINGVEAIIYNAVSGTFAPPTARFDYTIDGLAQTGSLTLFKRTANGYESVGTVTIGAEYDINNLNILNNAARFGFDMRTTDGVFFVGNAQIKHAVTCAVRSTGAIARLRNWEDAISSTPVEFQDGTNTQYLDIVLYHGSYYRCIRTYTYSTSGSQSPMNPSYWTIASDFNFVATQVLLADNALLKLASANQLLLTDNNGNVVAGMNGYGVSGNTDNIRIFAGTTRDNANFNTAPFRVTEKGEVFARKFTLTFYDLQSAMREIGAKPSFPIVSGTYTFLWDFEAFLVSNKNPFDRTFNFEVLLPVYRREDGWELPVDISSIAWRNVRIKLPNAALYDGYELNFRVPCYETTEQDKRVQFTLEDSSSDTSNISRSAYFDWVDGTSCGAGYIQVTSILGVWCITRSMVIHGGVNPFNYNSNVNYI